MNSSRRIQVSIDEQTLKVIEGEECIRLFQISTATKGMGFTLNSYRTPTGRFRVYEKVGDGEALNTIFKMRVPCGTWNQEDGADKGLVLTRVIRINGMDVENKNTLDRNVYIHGTNREERIGSPASMGCICLKNEEMVELYEMVEVGADLEILPATLKRGKLLFIDCDSTLSAIEGIDELARAKGADVFANVVALTHAAMNGEIPLDEVFPRRMEMIRPDRALCEAVASLYIDTMVPGVDRFISEMKTAGWQPVILSGGFAPLIRPLARLLGIGHVEAVPLFLDADGNYVGYGSDYPTTRNLGKNEIIREWKQALLPEKVIMIGDGISDLETKSDVDCFIGFGGVITRPKVQQACDFWLSDMNDRDGIMNLLSDKVLEPKLA